jgi:hypothetical protein
MAKTDLSNYNLAELKGLQFDIEKEIKSRQQDEVKKAREQILAIAHDVGVPVSELLAKAGGAKAGAKKGGASRARRASAIQPMHRRPGPAADASQGGSPRGWRAAARWTTSECKRRSARHRWRAWRMMRTSTNEYLIHEFRRRSGSGEQAAGRRHAGDYRHGA